MKGNIAGADVRGIKKAQIFEALCDAKIWLMGAMGAAIYVCNGGVTAFGSLIIKVCVRFLSPTSSLHLVHSLLAILAYGLFFCKPLVALQLVFPFT